jgi:hypothetical protein
MIFSSLKVASFGGFLLKDDIFSLLFAPRDSHKSQIQFVQCIVYANHFFFICRFQNSARGNRLHTFVLGKMKVASPPQYNNLYVV